MGKTSDDLPSTVDDQEILDNIDGRFHGPMPKFIDKFFGDTVKKPNDVSWPVEDDFRTCLCDFILNEAEDATVAWDVSSNATVFESVRDSSRLMLLAKPLPAYRQKIWDHIQVVGQFCTSNVGYKEGLLRLARSAHCVFANQPTRLFVHGFYIRQLTLELWMFDRSGLYCSEPMDLPKRWSQFKSILLAYQDMSRSQLGYLETLETHAHGRLIRLGGVSTETSSGRLYIQTSPIASREVLVGAGTTCYRGKSPDSTAWTHAVKFKWRWAKDRPEDELLRKAKKHGVTATVAVDYYDELETTANLRSGLRWGRHRRFMEPLHILRGCDEKIAPVTEGLDKYTEETNDFFQNRVLACIVTSPLGEPLSTFRSVEELLRVISDAVECHRSLLQRAKILHQDVSAGNILIADDRAADKSRGILIDLDSAKELDDGEQQEPGITGTRPFMAIGVLKREVHTYRHDLESFFYVFLWTIITNHQETPPPTSRLRRWSDGEWEELAARKAHDMTRNGFEELLKEFDPVYECLKPLARRLCQHLFRWGEAGLYTGTEVGREAEDALYGGMMALFLSRC